MASDRARSRLAAALLLAPLLLAPRASAEPSRGERDAARTLMDLGDRKIEAKDYAAALKAYQTADAIMGVPTTGIEVARTQLLLGHLVLAWEVATKVSRFPRKASEPEAFTRARAEGESLAGKLLPKIPTLRLSIRGAPAGAPLELSLDGEPLPASALDAPIKVDPGKHQVTASAPGVPKASAAITLGEGESSPLVLVLGDEPRKGDDAHASESNTRAVLIGVGLGALGTGLVAGSITGALSLTRTSSIKRQCATLTSCPPRLQGDIDAATTLANVSNVGFGVAAAGAVVAVIGLAIAPRSRPAPALRVLVSPVAGGGTLGLGGRF